MDNDGFMNDKELEAFQRRCFKIPLHPQSLEDVKHLVRKNTSDGFNLQGLTLKGFLFLHQTFVQKGRHETIWAVLRCFGYDNQLKLTKEYIRPTLRVSFGCSTELSYQGQHFLQLMFDKYDTNRDGCLSPAELQNFFVTCPFVPWGGDVPNTVLTNHLGWITKQGYMAQWTLTAYLDVSRALEYLAYLGYTYEYEGLTSAITVTREKRLDYHKRQTNRNVFYCRVFGSKKVGKTCFLQAFLGRNLQYIATLKRDSLPTYTCNSMNIYDCEKFLILHEMDWARAEQMSQDEALNTDVVCLLYDITDPASFKYVADIYMNYYRGTRIPCLVVSTKSEQVEIPQYYPLDPNEFCTKYKLQPVHKFSCLDKLSPEVYAKLITIANYPHLRGMHIAQGDYAWKFTIAATVLAGFGFMAFKMAKTHL